MINHDEGEHISGCPCCQAGLQFDLPDALIDLLHIRQELTEIGVQISIMQCPAELIQPLREALEYIASFDKSETRH